MGRMDSRPIIQKSSKLAILLDSTSLDGLIAAGHADAQTILNYTATDLFEFVRSPFHTNHSGLKEIPEFEIQASANGIPVSIVVTSKKLRTLSSFGYRIGDIEKVAEIVYEKQSITNDEKGAIFLVFVQAVLNRNNDSKILVTGNEVLIRKRLWFESHIPGCILNIVTVEEAKEIMGLFARYRGHYYISGNYTCNKGHWYFLSFRSKIPHYQLVEPSMSAFSTRFIYLLESVDEIGFQYYKGANNDTLDDTMYYFNYFISLITGILDSLASITKSHLKLKFERDSTPWKTSLNPTAGEDFLKAVREKSPDLRGHINDYVGFIKLIFALREIVIHRELLEKISVTYDDRDEKWEANFIRIEQDIVRYIKNCGDGIPGYDTITKWGILRLHIDYLLDPFSFAKAATEKLVQFSDRYLQLLGFVGVINKMGDDTHSRIYINTLDLFCKDHLGF